MAPKASPADAGSEVVDDFTTLPEPTAVLTLRPGKTIDDIPQGIRALVDKAHETPESTFSLTFSNGVTCKTFQRHAKDYAAMSDPRLMFQSNVQPDGVSIRYRVKAWAGPGVAEAAPDVPAA